MCRVRFLAAAVWVVLALVVLAPAAGGAATATTSVRIDADHAVMRTTTGALIVSRRPFGIVFVNSSGRVVLRQAAVTARATRLGPPPAPLAPGYGPPLQQTLAAPFEFTVGHEDDVVRSSGTWSGDLLSTVRTGTVYGARRVLSLTRAGAGLALVLSTGDPSGRRLRVTIEPGPGGAPLVSARPTPAAGVVGIGDTFMSDGSESFHGFGGMHLGVDQRGRSFYGWTAEENVNAASFHVLGSETGTLLYPNGPQAEYYPQASFASSRGYGFLLERPELARFRLDDRSSVWQVDVAARTLRFLVAPGDGRQAVARVTAVSGRQPAPPEWALGPTLDRATKLGESPAAYLEAVRQDLADVRRYRLPLRAYRIEGWGILAPAALRSVIAELRRMRIHPLVYFRAFVANDVASTEAAGTFQYAIRHRLVARTHSGAPYLFGDSFGGQAALLDFTNPQTLRWWGARIRAAFGLGADGFMQDFGEEVLPAMVFHDGESGLHMHNRYPVIYAEATRHVIARYMRSHPWRHLFFYTRAGYTGAPGSAAFEGGNFAGDETTDWTRSSGLQSVIPDMLNRAVGGAYGYSTDIGGYFDLFTPRPTTKELFLRWAELAVFTPFFRLHGSLVHGVHTPWSYDAQTVRIYNRLARLHQRALPLILRLWREADRTGVPPTRPLWLAFPRDRRAGDQDQEWLLGPNLLVAPVVREHAVGRQVYFPAGCWRSPDGRHTVIGPRSQTIAASLSVLPYFNRCGSQPLSR